MSTIDEALENQVRNIEEKYGKSRGVTPPRIDT
jgi:hypothetical protein